MGDLKRPLLRVDDRSRVTTGGGGAPIETGGAGAAPALPRPAAPSGLTVEDVALMESATTPKAAAQLAWTPPPGTSVSSYLIQWSLDPAFPSTATIGQSEPGDRVRTTIPGLPCSRATTITVYFRICSVARGGLYGTFSPAVSAPMPSDDVAPGPPVGLTAVFAADGTLEVRATPPSSANYARMAVRVLDTDGSPEWDTGEFVTGMWAWPPARNKLRTAGAYARAVLVEVKAVSWGGVSSTAVTATATMPVPSAPAGLGTTWQSDSGTAAADVIISWTPVAGMRYLLTADTGVTEREVLGGATTYSLAQNSQDHAGTPDKVLSISLVALDGLEQRSTAATITATNAAPPATTIEAAAGYNASISLILTPSTARDFKHFEIEVSKDTVVTRTVTTTEVLKAYEVEDGTGSYTFRARAIDAFGSAGAWSSATAAVNLDPLTVATLREDVIYSDSASTASLTLKAVLADDVL